MWFSIKHKAFGLRYMKVYHNGKCVYKIIFYYFYFLLFYCYSILFFEHGSCMCFLNYIAESSGLYFLNHSCRFSKIHGFFSWTFSDLAFWKSFLSAFHSASPRSPFLSQSFENEEHQRKWFLYSVPRLRFLGNVKFETNDVVAQSLSHFCGQSLVFKAFLYLTFKMSSVSSIYGSIVSFHPLERTLITIKI